MTIGPPELRIPRNVEGAEIERGVVHGRTGSPKKIEVVNIEYDILNGRTGILKNIDGGDSACHSQKLRLILRTGILKNYD